MRALIVGLTAVVVVASSCSSSGSPARTSATSASASSPGSGSAPASSGTATAAGSSDTPSGSSDTATGLTARLLTAAEVGPGFTGAVDTSPGTAPPCGSADSPTLDAQVPPAAKVKMAYTQTTPAAQVSEELTAYSDEAAAVKALGIGTTGLACTSGTLYGAEGSTTPVTIGAPTSPQLGVSGVDATTFWTLDGTDFKGGLLVVRYRSTHLLVMSFLTDKTTDTARLPDTNKIITTALTKAIG